ncbi:ABC transporter substrate-binding protein [Paenibacillus sediminis]|uniref:Peptide/nickel transport system substrate-binding protein n=1 Tax=Paenibacillus sediminis TaxID=664909 RepID=A0ABS4H6U3_9BACL|nr:ABC transporter substrate-binding protein [Paenibacillus sediminis]MBP1938250.1 peptide/nickel transport system substrate-binding protein [Paenibacillus sediminis]
MRKRMSLLLVMMLLSFSVLAACGGSKTAEPATTGETVTEPAKPADETTPQPEPAKEATPAGSEGLYEAADMSLNPAPAANRKDTLIVGMTSPKGVFNPLYGETTYDKYVFDVIFDYFLQVKGDGTYENSLADSIDVSPDGLKYTFHLKPGVKYTDGSPVTVKDYAFALKVLHDASYDGPIDILSFKVKGGQDYHDGKAKDISGIKIIDDNTIEIEVTEPTAYTRDTLGTVPFIPEAYYGKGYKQGDLEYIKALHDKPLGSGPYILKSFTPGQEADLEANPNYFKGAPKIKNLIYKATTDETKLAMLQSGEIDMDHVTVNQDNVDELQGMGFLDVNIFPTNGYGYVAFNFKEKKFQDQKVRQALVYGLNRKEIVEGVYGKFADVINIPQSKVSWAYTNEGIEPYDFNMDTAKKLLDDAGWKVGADGIREKDGEKFKINFSATADNPVVDALLPIMTKNYKELGIDIAAETLDFNAIMDKKDKGDFDMFFAAWGLTPDPDSTVYITKGAQNDVGYSNKTVDEWSDKGKKELNFDKRKEDYKALYQELNKDLPAIFMYQRRDMWAINGRVNGLEITPYKDFIYSLYTAELE